MLSLNEINETRNLLVHATPEGRNNAALTGLPMIVSGDWVFTVDWRTADSLAISSAVYSEKRV